VKYLAWLNLSSALLLCLRRALDERAKGHHTARVGDCACGLRLDIRAKVNSAALGQAGDRTPATGAQSQNNMQIFQ
jgi:hypothetical protein